MSLRKPSNKDDEKFISGIDSPYQAAKLRSASKDKTVDKFHSPVSFSWKAFWKSFIYENLPPVIFSPLAAIFLEGSLSRAWHVSQNRQLIAISTKHHSLTTIRNNWLIIYPASWLMNIGLFLALFSKRPGFVSSINFIISSLSFSSLSFLKINIMGFHPISFSIVKKHVDTF